MCACILWPDRSVSKEDATTACSVHQFVPDLICSRHCEYPSVLNGNVRSYNVAHAVWYVLTSIGLCDTTIDRNGLYGSISRIWPWNRITRSDFIFKQTIWHTWSALEFDFQMNCFLNGRAGSRMTRVWWNRIDMKSIRLSSQIKSATCIRPFRLRWLAIYWLANRFARDTTFQRSLIRGIHWFSARL